MRLNLVFHNVVQTESESEIDNKYTVTLDYLLQLIEEVNKSIINKQSTFDDFHIYFDDGYRSFIDLVFPSIKNICSKIKLAIITDKINQKDYLTEENIRVAIGEGIQIVSHGVSHAALAIYKENHLQPTPLGGEYSNSPFGQGESLHGNQVLYQLIESKKYLEKTFDVHCEEFVFPYGLYNDTIIALNNRHGIYPTISTCDEYLDEGRPLKPRILVDHERTIAETVGLLNKLSPVKL
ncbi:polysaccharide deacetylase family protein [Candidatus Woesebacteria bacterium]|nr:polysaccharide deacetylase family protein [Candidatus Woesebacteria bacterium]